MKLAVALMCMTGSALAEPVTVTLRGASVAPEGSAWARELRAGSRELETGTGGRVRIKWYLSAIAGGEVEMGERTRRGQIDFAASGGMLCNELMPTIRVLRLPGLFQSQDEAIFIVNQLHATLAAEAAEHGFVYLGSPAVGADRFFLPKPVHGLEALRALRLWSWDLDIVGIATRSAMGLRIVPADLTVASRMFDDHQLDGFYTSSMGALVFQEAIRAPYVLDWKGSFLVGCAVMSSRSFYSLAVEDQKVFAAVIAHTIERFDAVTAQTEEALLGGAFQHQGVQLVPVSESFRAQLFAAANEARDRVGSRFVPDALIQRVQAWLSDYRAEHIPRR